MINEELEQKLAELRGDKPREAAEYAYALAQIARGQGDNESARTFGKDAIALFDANPMDTLEQCAAINVTLGGIAIPSIIHQDVVRDRLQGVDLT